MRPMSTWLDFPFGLTRTKAERQNPSDGTSGMLNAAVSGSRLKRQNRRSVVTSATEYRLGDSPAGHPSTCRFSGL